MKKLRKGERLQDVSFAPAGALLMHTFTGGLRLRLMSIRPFGAKSLICNIKQIPNLDGLG